MLSFVDAFAVAEALKLRDPRAFRILTETSVRFRYTDPVTELIAEPALTQLFQGDAWELGRNIHPHQTLSEAVMEAAMAVDGRAIHI